MTQDKANQIARALLLLASISSLAIALVCGFHGEFQESTAAAATSCALSLLRKEVE